MVQQVQIVCILQIVNGVLVSLMGLLLCLAGPMLFAVISAEKKGNLDAEDQMFLSIMSIFYVVFGLLVLIPGLLNIIAPIRAMTFRGRTLWAIALFSNAVPVFTCYCAPTSIAIMVFGLIVFFNEEVAQAFKLGAEGLPPAEIRDRVAASRPRRRYVRYDEDE
jgi:hypothetical protein